MRVKIPYVFYFFGAFGIEIFGKIVYYRSYGYCKRLH